MSKRVIITGATGLIGKRLITSLLGRGYEITIITRNNQSAKAKLNNENIEYVRWDYFEFSDDIVKFIDGCFSVINLAGASIGGKRWNAKYKKLIRESRILTTRKIADAISKCTNKPESLINASAIGYYGIAGDEDTNENAKHGNDFLAKLTFDWEQEAFKAESIGIRMVIIRTGIVLDKNEGALNELIKPFKLFLGNYQGSGKQWISWIHIDDLIKLYLFALENSEIKGAINATAPQPVRNKYYCKAIGKAMHRPVFFKAPAFMLRIILGEFSDYVIYGKKILPEKALKNGFKFQFEDIENALNNILK